MLYACRQSANNHYAPAGGDKTGKMDQKQPLMISNRHSPPRSLPLPVKPCFCLPLLARRCIPAATKQRGVREC